MTSNTPYRVNYDEYITCPACRQRYQLLDWACARHRLTCGDPQIPAADQTRITANAAARGVAITWSVR